MHVRRAIFHATFTQHASFPTRGVCVRVSAGAVQHPDLRAHWRARVFCGPTRSVSCAASLENHRPQAEAGHSIKKDVNCRISGFASTQTTRKRRSLPVSKLRCVFGQWLCMDPWKSSSYRLVVVFAPSFNIVPGLPLRLVHS